MAPALRPGDPYRQWLQGRGAPPAGRLSTGGGPARPRPHPAPPRTGAGHFLRGAMAAPGGQRETGVRAAGPARVQSGLPPGPWGPRERRRRECPRPGGWVGAPGAERGWCALRSETEIEDSACLLSQSRGDSRFARVRLHGRRPAPPTPRRGPEGASSPGI